MNHGVTWILFRTDGQMTEQNPSSELARVTPGRGDFRDIIPGKLEDMGFLTRFLGVYDTYLSDSLLYSEAGTYSLAFAADSTSTFRF